MFGTGPVLKIEIYETRMGANVGLERTLKSIPLKHTNKVQNKNWGWHVVIF